ncbi:MAG: selenide, water dikinase SelD [Aggregatilineales bacterium]
MSESRPPVKLTALAACAGCAAKLSPRELAHVLQPLAASFPIADFPAMLVGLEAPDDAAVYQLNETQAIIATVDFFPPVVDEPFAFGAIAAANAMSDVYAMGGEVLFGINLVAFPETLDTAILSEILRGGAYSLRQGGGAIVGGHSIKDDEPKYGVAVTGIVHPQRVLTKAGAQAGDVLILTKPLGTGVITTALKRGLADPADVDAAVQSMMRLNRAAAQAAQAVGVHAMTDVTGYSLLGHAREIASLSKVDIVLSYSALPWLQGAQRYAEMECFPGGANANRAYYEPHVTFPDDLSPTGRMLLFDPQTSGGLLISVMASRAPALLDELAARGAGGWSIGHVIEGSGKLRVEH